MVYQDAIFERLEVTRKFGLVTDYLVSWSGLAGCLKPKVTVWRSADVAEVLLHSYVAELLRGMVPEQRISIAAD